LELNTSAIMEPSLADAELGQQYQFLRQGYYTADNDRDSGKLVFNRTVNLKSSWKGVKK